MDLNQGAARCLERMARMLELLGEDSFRVSAHARAGRAIADHIQSIATMDRAALLAIDGIGPKLADKILEFARTGRIAEHDALAERVPPGLPAVMEISGVGPKTARALWQTLGVASLADLQRVIDDGSILTVPRMGAKTVANITKSIAFAKTSGLRLPLGLARPLADRVVATLRERLPGARIEAAGSLRRGCETIGDIDILVATLAEPEAVFEAFTTLPGVEQVLVAGGTKASVRMRADESGGRFAGDGESPRVQVDLRLVPESSWGAGLMYFTGSKNHNVRLRERAQKQGLTLNEYGLFVEDHDPIAPQHRGVTPIVGRTEEEVFERLGVAWVPPELREDHGELDAPPPTLIELDDIKAELHAHTTASDGVMSIEELAARARARGLHTLAVTDHSKSSTQANGLSEERLMAHVEAIRRVKVKGLTILAGSEVDILADGTLDYEDRVLRELDIVVASPHVALAQDPETATQRLLAAIRNPFVNIIGHPTGRLINRRPGLAPDIAAIASAARDTGVALEVNANWLRLDLRDAHVRAAVTAGCLVAIDTDAHEPGDFDHLRHGVATARRGGLTAATCVNAWTAKKIREWLASRR